MTAASTKMAIIGGGGFAHFIAQSASASPYVEFVAVADPETSQAEYFASRFHVPVRAYEDILTDTQVDAVAIAAPPNTHFDLSMRALAAHKDVFCEKPLGANAEQAVAIRDLAQSSGRVVVVDHVLRYNPLLAAIERIQRTMGWHVVRFLFENDAADESLPREHWFWDEQRSGGIFIEHGVHFFDAAEIFHIAAPQVVVAAATRRAGWPAPDMVSATIVHGDCLATHTHSFTHAHRAERQLMRIDFGSAEARIEGWIPVAASVTAFTDEAGEAVLRQLLGSTEPLAMPGITLPPHAVRIESATEPDADVATGRGLTFPASRRIVIRLSLGGEQAKAAIYAASVRAALEDLHRCRIDRTRRPVSNAATAAGAVRLAEAATAAMHSGQAVSLNADS